MGEKSLTCSLLDHNRAAVEAGSSMHWRVRLEELLLLLLVERLLLQMLLLLLQLLLNLLLLLL